MWVCCNMQNAKSGGRSASRPVRRAIVPGAQSGACGSYGTCFAQVLTTCDLQEFAVVQCRDYIMIHI